MYRKMCSLCLYIIPIVNYENIFVNYLHVPCCLDSDLYFLYLIYYLHFSQTYKEKLVF